MSSIDNRFYVTSDVDTYYVDKDTGFPLAAGVVTFYSDINRTVKKTVYELTGSPGFYTYSALPNPCTLSGVGTFQDAGGNNIVPYYFPYEGTPDDTNNDVELYYITVYSSGGIEQLTRQAWPNNVAGDIFDTGADLTNYIPNGQFLIHNTIVEDVPSGPQPPFYTQGAVLRQPIAQGGWSFDRSVGGSSTFLNSFTEIEGFISGLDDFPRWAFNFECTSFNSNDAVRDLSVSWPDVNKFSRESTLQPYTFTIAAGSNDSGTYNFDVRLIRYYGTGGSPSATSDMSIGTFTITPGYQYFSVTIDNIPGDVGTIGTNNDDTISIAIRGPSSTWNVQTTDWSFIPGDVTITSTPIQTNAEMLAQSLAGWVDVPNPNGNDLYLKPALTLTGETWDSSEVGEIKTFLTPNNFTSSIHNTSNLLLMDGNSYVTQDYSPLGIPYARLQSYLWDNTNNWPIWGTGVDFATCYVSPSDNSAVLLNTNQPLAQTNAIDGSVPTGFTFTGLLAGNDTYDMFAYTTHNTGQIFLMSTVPMTLADNDFATAGDSGFTVAQDYPSLSSSAYNSYQLIGITVTGVPTAGTYFTYTNSANDPYYVWFTVNGSGSDPAPGGTGILVQLNSAFSNSQIAALIRDAISGFCSTYIIMTSFTFTAGSFFQFQAGGTTYNVTYVVDNVGTATAGGTPIYVDVASSATIPEVALATKKAINSYKFATPNASGCFLRSLNNNAGNIIGNPASSLAERFTLTDSPSVNYEGSYEFSDNFGHAHNFNFSQTTLPTLPPNPNGLEINTTSSRPTIVTSTLFGQTSNSGGVESRPFNMGVFYAIKY